MTKPVRMLNKYHIKEMLLHGNPQYENFYKEELIQFCKIAQEELKHCHENLKNINNEFLKYDWKNSTKEQIVNQLKSLYNSIFENGGDE